MNIRTRIKRLEIKAGKNCECSDIVSAVPGETIKPCGVCGKTPATIVLPALSDYAAVNGISRNAKIYAGFDFNLV